MTLLRSIATVGSFTMASRVLGFVRDILIAATLGAGMLADVFFVAFKFPNLFRRLFAEGAFSAAFVPLFAGTLEDNGKDAAHDFAEQALSVLFWALLIFVITFELVMPWLMYGFAPGFAASPEKFNLAILLTRITFPYLLFISLVSLMAGVLNSLGRFASAAATPILLNLCLIGAILWLAPLMKTPVHALAWGVAGAGLLQFVWLYIFCVRADITLFLRFPRITPNIKLMCRRIVPVAIGAGIYQVNLLIDTIIASFLPTGSISYLFFADRVNQLPLGIIGVAVGTALLPLLSRQLRSGQYEQAMHSQNRALEIVCFFTLPAAAALIVIAQPVISVLFERGAFDAAQVQATASALAVYAIGLPAYVLIKALTPGYFARGDTATPVKIAVFTMTLNLGLNLILMGPFLHVGIAMATAISAWVNAALLTYILMRRGHLAIDHRLATRLPRIAAASICMAVLLVPAMWWLKDALSGDIIHRAMALTALVASGLGSFAIIVHFTGAAKISDIKGLIRKDNR